MHQLTYRIKNLSPLVLSAKYGDMNMVSTEKYIPGTSVLGILAKQYLIKQEINDSAHEDINFYNWFLLGNLKITNAYTLSQDQNNNDRIFFPAPFSIQKEKTSTNVIDLLFIEEMDDTPRKPINSFCYLDGGNLQIRDVETSLNFHHARDREKGISKEGQIFNYESIAPNQLFEGQIIGAEDDLKTLISQCGTKWKSSVGRSKNAQYGQVTFELQASELKPFNPAINPQKEISLTLLSNTIIYNENGFATTNVADLEKYLGLPIKKAFIKTGNVENFIRIWRLKKPSEACFMAGSVFLLDISAGSPEQLLVFQKSGIGERTHEGFGQCCFGWQTVITLNETKLSAFINTEKPPSPIPQKTIFILRSIIKDYLIKQSELTALEDFTGFEATIKHISGSLIGRLNAMVKEKARSQFVVNLELLRKSAKDKLERCHNNQDTLLDFIKKREIKVSLILQKNQNNHFRQLCDEINYQPEQDTELEEILYQTYFKTFFSTMRKNLKI